MHKLMNKKAEIKNRIDLINRGEVPAGYKCCWGYIYPESWTIKSLKDLFYKVKTKNAANESLPVLTNSATLGVILQDEYFDREIVNDENTNNYYIVENGDFMYNPRISSNAPAGPINRNTLGQKGIASPLYTIFRAKDTKNIEFVEKYFKSNYWHRYMKSVSNQGARHDRLNISDEDFMRMPIPQPSQQEQEKIAKILNCCDKVIELKQKLLAEKLNEKKYYMSNIFNNNKHGQFYEYDLGEICNIATGKLDANKQCKNGKYRFYTCAAEYSYIDSYAFDTEALLISGNGAHVGYIHYYKGKFNAYQRTYVLDNFVGNIFFVKYQLDKFLKKYIHKEKNAGNTPYILLSTLMNIKIYLSKDKTFENTIVKMFLLIDKQIDYLEQELDQYKQLKKALSQLLLTGIIRTVEVDCEN